MRFLKLKILLASLVAVFAFSGCTPEQAYVANTLVSGNSSSYAGSSYYNKGYRDGCKSRKKGYTIKNRYSWNRSSNYRSGWYAGKRQCRRSYTTKNYYNRGYSDGCYSKRYRGTRKNRGLYRNSNSYYKGWNRGYRNCRRR